MATPDHSSRLYDMDRKELLRIIQKAAEAETTKLVLSGKNIGYLPPDIGRLTKLKELRLRNCQLTSLPPEIGQLTNLEKLYLGNNQLVKIPSEISQLINLKELDLNSNGLSQLSPSFLNTSLSCLQKLYLSGNHLRDFPPEFCCFTSLTELDLNSNQLVNLPPEIGQLFKLKRLFVRANKLIKIPAEIGKLTELNELHLNGNQLKNLPPEIGQLTKLKKLNLSMSRLESLPTEVRQLINLKELHLIGTDLPIPPEILGKTREPNKIINYYINLKINCSSPLNEAKVLIVGQGSVGKTSLVKRLIENDFSPQQHKTEGIDIKSWHLPINDQEVQLNIWDFGGQEIMHATHQFFLTKRSLYLLVLDARQGEDENRLEYWLKIIQSFSGESPIIIVGNKIDQHPLDIDRRGLQNKYKTLKAIVETSCQSGKGIEQLKELIQSEIAKLEHVFNQFPLTWFEVKTKLEQIDRDYITYEDYERLCKDENVTEEISQRTLIGFLHDLGVVLNFQDDPRLEDTHVLNPEWVTNGVYKILNDRQLIIDNKGILSRQDLKRILDRKRYPHNKHIFIINMMRKFELCFALDGSDDKRFLIPDLLPKEEPYTGEWLNALAFEYHYNVLPHSIISRFIVRMNNYIHQHTYWRNGVVLVYEGNNLALVKADREDKKIFIRIAGSLSSQRRAFLAIVRSHFEHIHKTIPGIQIKEKVPLPDCPEVVVDYQHLLTLEWKRVATFIPEGYSEEVNVKHLLDGVEKERDRKARREGHLTRENVSNLSINIQNTNAQENIPMSNTYQYGSGDNIAGDKVMGDKIGTQINNSQNLAEAAQEIQQLLDQLSQNYPDPTPAQKIQIAAQAVEEIEKNPTLKARVTNALKEAGTTALEEAVDHPAIKIVVAGVKGYIDA